MAELDKNDLLIILHTLSNIMRIVGAALFIPAIVASVYGEWRYSESFSILALALILIFTLARHFLGHRHAKFKHAIISIAIAWFLLGLVSAVPFVLNGMNGVDAFFESVSGWTGTGLTMIEHPEELPFALSFWRGFIQWLGGFGIVLMALLFYERPQTAKHLFVAEGRTENFYMSLSKVARTIIKIYFAYTALGIILFLFAGLNLFDAVIHSFTSIATGGFSTNGTGVGFYGPWAMAVTILLMALGGISFESHYELLRGKVKRFFSNPEIRLFLAIILIATALISINFFFFGNTSFFDGFFYIVSAITGTGATSFLAIQSMPGLSIFVLILLMVFGSCYGSTTGALKLWRIIILFKVIRREIHRAFLPANAVLTMKIGERAVCDADALKGLSYMVLYVFFIAIGSIIFMLAGYGVIDSIFTVASAQGNVGLASFGGAAWFSMEPILKILLSLHMIAGRMEIIPLLVLIKSMGVGRQISAS